jgi:hypothetical protein
METKLAPHANIASPATFPTQDDTCGQAETPLSS